MRYVWGLVFGLFFLSSLAYAKPKLEIGAGFGGQYLADYRGSKEYQAQVLPFPFLIYRGEVIKADSKGVRGLLFENDRYEFNFSAEASLNGGSENNPLRIGMPELDSAFEFGPSFNINLSGDDLSEGWMLRLPVRGVFTISSSGGDYIGYNANPKLTHRKTNAFWGWDSSFNIGVLYGSDKLHDYYYSVDQEYVTNHRSFYDAESGFSGAYLKWSARKRSGDMIYGVSLRYDNLNGVEFEDSPLVETDDYFSLSLGVGWIFWKSK